MFQTPDRDPLSPLPPSVAHCLPISPADWGPLSNVEKAAAIQTGSPVAGVGVGVLKTVGTAAQQLFACHTDSACSQKALLVL